MVSVESIRSLILVSAIVLVPGCQSIESSGLKTDLGTTGNAKIVAQFLEYKKKSNHCTSSGVGTRVIVTGFGLFSAPPVNALGIPYNVSGLVSRFMASDAVFPSPIDTSSSGVQSNFAAQHFAKYSHMPKNAEGAIVSQRDLIIDGKPVSVCFILLDVIWDQAAAIILYESTLFKPERIIMSGLNGGEKTTGMFEAGAINHATSFEGFLPDGKSNQDNIPIANSNGDSPVLPKADLGVEKTIAMLWNAKDLAAKTLSIAKRIKKAGNSDVFKTRGEDAARPSNDYICNNVSFVILHAIKGAVINLAGGKLRFGPASMAPAPIDGVEFIEIDKDTAAKVKSAGFFHYPDIGTDVGSTVYGWSLVIAKAMTADL